MKPDLTSVSSFGKLVHNGHLRSLLLTQKKFCSLDAICARLTPHFANAAAQRSRGCEVRSPLRFLTISLNSLLSQQIVSTLQR
jgi:hypothetical protein